MDSSLSDVGPARSALEPGSSATLLTQEIRIAGVTQPRGTLPLSAYDRVHRPMDL